MVLLATCSARAARSRVAGLTAHFDRVRIAVGAYFDLDRTLEPAMLKGLIETELKHCLAKLIAAGHDELAIEWVAADLDRHCGKDTLDDTVMAAMAVDLGVEGSPP